MGVSFLLQPGCMCGDFIDSGCCGFAASGKGDRKEAGRMIREICFIAGQNFSGWHKKGRIWMSFALGLVLCLMLSDQMLAKAQTYETALQFF